LLVKNPAGKGTAILLNFSAFSLPDLGAEGMPPEVGALFETLLAEAGVLPSRVLTDESGAKARGIETTRWQDGDIEILSLFQPYGQKREVTVTLNTSRAVYALNTGEYVGQRRQFPAAIVPARATFFALSPNRAARPKLTLASAVVERGTLARCMVAAPGAGGLHAFRLIVSADGKEMDCFQQKVAADGKGMTVDIPVAFNDPAGTWKIKVVDVMTGLSSTASLLVK